jgi:hypothetical protein
MSSTLLCIVCNALYERRTVLYVLMWAHATYFKSLPNRLGTIRRSTLFFQPLCTIVSD